MRDHVAPSTSRAIPAVLFDTFGSAVDWRSGVVSVVSGGTARRTVEVHP